MPLLPSLDSKDGISTSLDRFNPELKTPLLEMHQILLRGNSPFTIAERELLAAYVSGLNACTYCYGSHKATAIELGVNIRYVLK